MRPSLLNHVAMGTFFLIEYTWGHSFILAIEGGNRRRSTGFGTRLTSRGNLVQNTGIMKKKEIEAGTTTPCGRIFGGDGLKPFVIDVAQELANAEQAGVPSATEDGSISMSVYVHNPDGAGPYTCEYSSDATLQQLQPMPITTQIEGDKGTNPVAKDFAYPLVARLPSDAVCRGGAGGDTCIMRCINPLGFGSCAAIKPFSPSDQPGGPMPPSNQPNGPTRPDRPDPPPEQGEGLDSPTIQGESPDPNRSDSPSNQRNQGKGPNLLPNQPEGSDSRLNQPESGNSRPNQSDSPAVQREGDDSRPNQREGLISPSDQPGGPASAPNAPEAPMSKQLKKRSMFSGQLLSL